MVKRIRPDSWPKGVSDLIKERLPLLDRLSEMLGPECADKMEGWRRELQHVIDDERQWEAQEARAEAARQKEQAEAARQKEQARFE